MSPPAGAIRAGRREWTGLAVLALPTLLVSLDTFVMLLAIPHISIDLGAGSTQQLWIMDIYGFLVAGLLITAGALGDRWGRRRLLLVGAAAFGLASAAAAYSTSPEMLIAARALLGVAGATLTPSTLALIMNMFQDPGQRATAVGIWAGCFTTGAIIGPLVGGIMLQHFWWGSVLLLGVPAMALLLMLGPVVLPEFRSTAGRDRLDLPSVLLSLAAILPIVHGLKETAAHGWRLESAVSLGLGLAAAVVFVRRQNRLADPLLDLRLFAGRRVSSTLTAMLLYTMLSGGTMVFVAQYLQLNHGLSPLSAGLAMVPGMVTAIIGFQLAPLLARRVPTALLFGGGLLTASAGLVTLAQASASTGPALVVAGFCLTSLGGGPLVSLGTNVVVGSAPPERAGSAAGLTQTSNECGYALGIAVLGSIGAYVYRTHMDLGVPRLPDGVAAAAADSAAAAGALAAALPGEQATALLAAAREAFTGSLQTVATISAIVLAVTAVALLKLLKDHAD
ncbi:MFS transporter [Nonomuraea sp. NPDC050790]|uniref:MFS transporter n=1 Tax=Nonomuraea sp. NPDC050790 TaxID=3364371 RepID=UPI00378ABBCD